MTLKKSVCALLGALGILILVLDARTALQGAAAGMELCIRTVVPSLFPFLFLCGLLTDSLWGSRLLFLRVVGKRLGIPAGAESILLSGFLGGYPAGASAVGNAVHQGSLSEEDGEHLLTFCSNAGPAFLFGMTARQFPNLGWIFAMWLCLILSSLITGRLMPAPAPSSAVLSPRTSSLSGSLNRTVKTMGAICGWVLLFRILTEFLNRWALWIFPDDIQVLLTGLLELSNGCCSLSRMDDLNLRFLVCTLIHAFGGLCVTMQTASVIGGLSMKPYLMGKVIQTLFSVVLAALWLRFGWICPWAILVIILAFPGKAVYNAFITNGRTLYAVSEKN